MSINWDWSAGLWRAGVNYSRPVGLDGARLAVGGSYSSSNVVNGSLASIDLNSQSLSGYASYQYPVVVQPDQIGWLGISANTEHLTADISGTQLTDTVIREGNAFANWLWRRPNWTASANLQFAFGDADSATSTSTDGSFQYLPAGADIAGVWFNKLAVRGKFLGLYAFSRNNPSSYDVGFAVPFRGSDQSIRDEDMIAGAGAGIGLRLQVGPRVSGDVSVSWPLRDTTGFDASKRGAVYSFKLTSQL